MLANVYAGAASLAHYFQPQIPHYATTTKMADMVYGPPLNLNYNQPHNPSDYYAITNFQPEYRQNFPLPEIPQYYAKLELNQTDKRDTQQSFYTADKPIYDSNLLSGKNHPFNSTQQSFNVAEKPTKESKVLTDKNQTSNFFTQSPKFENFTSRKAFEAASRSEKDSKVKSNPSKGKTPKKKKVLLKQKNPKPSNKPTKQKPDRKDSEIEHEYYYVYDDSPVRLVF